MNIFDLNMPDPNQKYKMVNWSIIIICIGTFFFLMFSFLGIGVFCDIYIEKMDNRFESAQCLIIGYSPITKIKQCSKIHHDQKSDRNATCKIFYDALIYVNVSEPRGNTWFASANKQNDYKFKNEQKADKWQTSYSINDSVKCYYDSFNHSDVVMKKYSIESYEPLMIAIFINLLLFFLGFTILIASFLLGWKIDRDNLKWYISMNHSPVWD